MTWKIIEIETAAPGWRTRGGPNEDGAPVALWALVEDETGRRLVVGLDPTVQEGPGARLIDVHQLVERIAGVDDGYTYRAPIS